MKKFPTYSLKKMPQDCTFLRRCVGRIFQEFMLHFYSPRQLLFNINIDRNMSYHDTKYTIYELQRRKSAHTKSVSNNSLVKEANNWKRKMFANTYSEMLEPSMRFRSFYAYQQHFIEIFYLKNIDTHSLSQSKILLRRT